MRRAILVPSLCALLLAGCHRSRLPAAISDEEFWALTQSLSEPPGTFALSDNFVSNEPRVAENARFLLPRGGVYIGVGPEQNFSYIARLRPAAAFIIDIRRENRDLHLLYKALFEISSDRVDFVSRLFSRPRPGDLRATATVEDIFRRYSVVPPSAQQRDATMELVRARLLRGHGFPLGDAELGAINRAFTAFYTDGPEIQFWGSRAANDDAVRPSFRQLMTAPDLSGQARTFLGDEQSFRTVKDLHARNLIVPVVGDFAGPSAIRRVGDYVRQHGDVVRAFYGSNVAVYLNSKQTAAFCANLASLPVASDTWFVESDAVRALKARLKACGPAVRGTR